MLRVPIGLTESDAAARRIVLPSSLIEHLVIGPVPCKPRLTSR